MRRFTPLLLWSLTACTQGGGSDTGGPPATAGPLASGVTTVTLEIDYATGAEPYTGDLIGGDGWDLFVDNATAVFDGTRTVDVPTTLDAMSEITVDDPGPYSATTLLDIGAAHRDQPSTADTHVLHVLWLDGYYEDEDGNTDERVLGVFVNGTPLIAMFKPAIESGAVSDEMRRLAEQLILTHEFGHSVGLVNNGVPPTTDHHDADNGAHCTNDQCVMYWAFEGASALTQFAKTIVATGNSVVFDEACLADVAAQLE